MWDCVKFFSLLIPSSAYTHEMLRYSLEGKNICKYIRGNVLSVRRISRLH